MLKSLRQEAGMSYILEPALGALKILLGNMLKDPENEKFRTLNLENEKLKERLFRFTSALELL